MFCRPLAGSWAAIHTRWAPANWYSWTDSPVSAIRAAMMGVAASTSVVALHVPPRDVSTAPMVHRPSAVRVRIWWVSSALASRCAVARGRPVASHNSVSDRGFFPNGDENKHRPV